MLDATAPERVKARGSGPVFGLRKDNVVRLKNLALAAAIALAAMALSFLNPLDQFIWSVQSRIVAHQPSGDIIFVGAERDLTDPSVPARREELAEALGELDRQGVGRVYIDATFTSPSQAQADQQLAEAIASLGPRAILVDRIEDATGKTSAFKRTIDEIGGATDRVVSKRDPNWLGLIWTREYAHDVQGGRKASFEASLAGVDDLRDGSFQVDYSIPSNAIASVSLRDMNRADAAISVAGKSVIIGADASLSDTQQRIPGDPSVPASFIAIYAAETLKSGRFSYSPALPTFALFIFLFGACLALITGDKSRKFLYFAANGMLLCVVYIGSLAGIRFELSYCLLALFAYAAIRSRSRWKSRIALVDAETGLSKLQALELSLAGDKPMGGHLVVARIHGYEHVLKTLPRNERAQYILKLVDRLRAADSALTVYSEGHHLAWHSSEEESHRLAEHLEGTRAMFAAPVNVSGSSVDVGISFGVARLDGDPASRLAAAVAAAEESSEALQPIKLAESNSRFDELWDISLRARIDEAMAAGEIFCVYQPKVDTRNGTMTGVEALVRWQDPARGFIPPMHFIAQCEKAGRMEALTQYVLEHSCAAGRLMHFRGRSITMSVNISATLLSDMRIVGMVRNVVQATGFDPRFLVLEVTETSRIGNLETAEMVLNELKGLGARISMDDFGVGETNFETFFELPFDEVKIDRLFVDNIAKSTKAKAIVSSIVEMGREARIGVVAEGAEDAETLKILTEMGCTHVQGYVLARPMSLDNLMEFNILDVEDAQKA